MRSRERSECLKKAKVDRGLYQCAICPPGKLTRYSDTQVDHKITAVPLTGWDGFDSFIERLFCPVEDLQVLCKPCHEKITAEQREVRKSHKPAKKVKAKKK